MRKATVELVDDIDGGEAAETVSFGLDGVEYTIDLSSDNAMQLRRVMALYVKCGRRMSGRRRTPQTIGGDRVLNRRIRQWARRQGRQIGERGRLSAELIASFHAAQGS